MKQMFFVKVVAAVFWGGVMVVECANVNSNRGSAEMTEPIFQPMPSDNAVFTVEGIPRPKYMVGGGFAGL